ncbi:hypothetical protein TNCV_4703871 [Trichonephila clavipes]|nr:hypothetical protein TNCV_4703871 [Trichonephila clavipes]
MIYFSYSTTQIPFSELETPSKTMWQHGLIGSTASAKPEAVSLYLSTRAVGICEAPPVSICSRLLPLDESS